MATTSPIIALSIRGSLHGEAGKYDQAIADFTKALQLVPMLARFAAEAPGMRLNAGVLLLPMMSPLHVAEEFATLDIITGGKIILGVGLGYRDVEFKAFGMTKAGNAQNGVHMTDGIMNVALLAKGGLERRAVTPSEIRSIRPPSAVAASTLRTIASASTSAATAVSRCTRRIVTSAPSATTCPTSISGCWWRPAGRAW